MSESNPVQIAPATGKLWGLIPGRGAVSTTFMFEAPGLRAEHGIFIQLMKLQNIPRRMHGAELITHLGLEYYDEGAAT